MAPPKKPHSKSSKSSKSSNSSNSSKFSSPNTKKDLKKLADELNQMIYDKKQKFNNYLLEKIIKNN